MARIAIIACHSLTRTQKKKNIAKPHTKTHKQEVYRIKKLYSLRSTFLAHEKISVDFTHLREKRKNYFSHNHFHPKGRIKPTVRCKTSDIIGMLSDIII